MRPTRLLLHDILDSINNAGRDGQVISSPGIGGTSGTNLSACSNFYREAAFFCLWT